MARKRAKKQAKKQAKKKARCRQTKPVPQEKLIKASETLMSQQEDAARALLATAIHITGLARGLMMATTVTTHEVAGGIIRRAHVRAARALAKSMRSALPRLESAADIWEAIHPEPETPDGKS